MAVTTSTDQVRGGARSCPVCGSMLRAEHLEGTSDGVQCIFCGAHLPTEPGTQVPSVPDDVGDTLRQARLARGETLSDAARWTCLRARYLTALERNHPVDEFPGRSYARYFLREYAEHLDLDPEPLLRSFDATPGGESPLPRSQVSLTRPEPRWRAAAIVSALLLVVLAIASIRGRGDGGENAATTSPSPAVQEPRGAGIAGAQPRAAVEPTRPLHATLVLTARCWVSITVDGRDVPAHTYPAGRTLDYAAKHTLEVWLGDGGGVDLTVGGVRVPTGAPGQPIQLSFTWRNGEVRQL